MKDRLGQFVRLRSQARGEVEMVVAGALVVLAVHTWLDMAVRIEMAASHLLMQLVAST